MSGKGSKRVIRRALALHENLSSLLDHQSRLEPAVVHQLRLSVKELRALWQVLEPFLAEDQSDTADRDIARAAKLLAGARDEHVQLETLAKCIRKAEEEALPALQQAREQLIAQQSESMENAVMSSEIVARFEQDLERWQRVELAFGRHKLIRDGYGRLYRKARKRFRKAAESGHAEEWHRLRRWAKYLALLAPTVLGDDSSAKTTAKRYANLAGKLGDLHDLHVLGDTLTSLADQDEAMIVQANAIVDRRADLLQNKCHKQSKRLFDA